ncbi:helix-turn-helix domain-containing protein [Lactobacillus sp. PSON]|uniref:helix-turn-helix domain-containing protein n=1 Tax=Lactobacillus sp. PSON TaxID=3455454 RepID=UPI0040432E60
MKIGEALQKVRIDLGLSQAKMCEGIVQRPFYTLVESGKSGISAESLIMILVSHKIDINYFYNLIYKSYMSKKEIVNEELQEEMEYAVNSKNYNLLEYNCNRILSCSDNNILKIRAIVTNAYFKGDLSKVDKNLKYKICMEFDKEEKWVDKPEYIRLLANTMPLLKIEMLDSLIMHLLKSLDKKEFISELMMERYLRIFGNYLVTCFDRGCYLRKEYSSNIYKVIKYILSASDSFHLIIYRFHAHYMYALFKNNEKERKEIIKFLKYCGYGKIIKNWPKANV